MASMRRVEEIRMRVGSEEREEGFAIAATALIRVCVCVCRAAVEVEVRHKT